MHVLIALAAAGLLRAGEVPQTPADAAAIMTKMAANVEAATDLRRQYVYRQRVRSNVTHSNGQISRREDREYSVIPQPQGTEKKIVSFKGEYRDGKKMLPYSEPGFKPKHGDNGDSELVKEITDGLVNDSKSRDGIPESLFPLRSKNLSDYKFVLKGQQTLNGRPAYQIGFEPVTDDLCIHIGGKDGDDCEHTPWRGDAWIDAEEFQPVRITTMLGKKIPWAIRHLMGIDIHQLGFSVSYIRVDGGVWFPQTYGTEFHFDVFWFYKRTITLSLESSQFQKTGARSTIQYNLP